MPNSSFIIIGYGILLQDRVVLVEAHFTELHFTSAMLCVARSLPSCGVRPSVRPSHADIVLGSGDLELTLLWHSWPQRRSILKLF